MMQLVFRLQSRVGQKSIERRTELANKMIKARIIGRNRAMHGIMSRHKQSCMEKSPQRDR